MKRLFLRNLLSLVIVAGILFPSIVVSHAQVNFAIPNPSRYNSLEEVISAVAALIRPLFILTFGAMLLFGAYSVLSSKGEDEKIANGKKTITASIIGFVIAVLAPSLVSLVANIIGIDAFNTTP